jgi:PAT family beta-lactamase induction signal transducer AmpG
MQAMPVAIVQEVSVVAYKDFGVDNKSIAVWTSLIALPWSIKLLWGPLVDLNGTKRRWLLLMQGLIVIGLLAFAFALKLPNFLGITLSLLFTVAIFSATCDIATDGFYLLTLPKDQQAAFVGIQSTFYRLGRLFCVGLLPLGVGLLRDQGFPIATCWVLAMVGVAIVYGVGRLANARVLPRPTEDRAVVRTEGGNGRHIAGTVAVIALALCGYFTASALVRICAHGLWISFDGSSVGRLDGWMLTPAGIENELIQLAGCFVGGCAALWAARKYLRGTEVARSFGSFLGQQGILAILAFMMFYRFSEAMVTKMAPLFFKSTHAEGGLALGDKAVGVLSTGGVVGLVIGGILGGVIVSKLGLKRSFWPLAVAMHLPNLLYLWAAASRPAFAALLAVAAIDQMGYGIGYAAYSVFLMRIAQRDRFWTSHFAIGTGLGALFINAAGVLSGVLQASLGFVGFFIAVCFFTLPGMVTLLFVPKD